MGKLGEKVQGKPGSKLMRTGVVLLVLSIVLLAVNLTRNDEKYVAGVGYIQVGGTPSAGFWILLLGGLLLAGIGIARRVLGSK
jgi:succinate dehydrogenase hydrophobic anchor subunit